jgi:hypothetical protein
MANVTVKAQFMLSTGELVSMSSTLAEGTASELQTSTTYSTAATSIGQFANGKTIVQRSYSHPQPQTVSLTLT